MAGSEVAYDPAIGSAPIVIPPGEGHVLGNVEFLARTADTPRFNLAIIEIVSGRELEVHVHQTEDDAFYILEGELTFLVPGQELKAGSGTFVLIPPASSTASETMPRSRSACSTSTLPPDSTAASVCPTD